LTNLINLNGQSYDEDAGMSSLMDTWISLVQLESNGERNRGLYVLKSRGMSHSNQIREYQLSSKGVTLIDAYLGSGGVLTGSARITQEASDAAAALRRQRQTERTRRDMERKRALLERQITELRAAFEAEEGEARQALANDASAEERIREEREALATKRGVIHDSTR
jgi:circadian clock protein KaiC